MAVPAGSPNVPEPFAAMVRLADAAVWAGAILPRQLPKIASEMLSIDMDSPVLRRLAALDLAPFDPRDARDGLDELLGESGVQRFPIGERIDQVAHLVATAYDSGRLTTSDMFGLFHQLALAGDYPDNYEVMYLYGLEDEWRSDWGRLTAEVEEDARKKTRSLALRRPPPPACLVDAVGTTKPRGSH